jgi:hypothetical protein
VTVDPGPVIVCVSASTVIVVVRTSVVPGRVDVRVVPSSVMVVGIPGSRVVTVDVTVEGGIVMVCLGSVVTETAVVLTVTG